MRAFVQVKETQLTKAFHELETHIWETKKTASWIETVAQTYDGAVSFEQIMETDEGNLTFVMAIDLEKEKQMREEVEKKAEELRRAIKEYENVLVKKMILALDEPKG